MVMRLDFIMAHVAAFTLPAGFLSTIPDEHGTLNGQENLHLWSTCERLAYPCPRVVM